MIKEEKNTGINFFQRYLTVWVFLCMIVGVLLGHFAPALPAFSNNFYSNGCANLGYDLSHDAESRFSEYTKRR